MERYIYICYMISSIKIGSDKSVSLSEILNTIDKKETAVLTASPAMAENKRTREVI